MFSDSLQFFCKVRGLFYFLMFWLGGTKKISELFFLQMLQELCYWPTCDQSSHYEHSLLMSVVFMYHLSKSRTSVLQNQQNTEMWTLEKRKHLCGRSLHFFSWHLSSAPLSEGNRNIFGGILHVLYSTCTSFIF